MSDADSLPPSYQEPQVDHDAHRELLVHGADEPGTITFSSSDTPLYRLVPSSQDGGVQLVDVAKAQPIYTIQADPTSKVFTIAPTASQQPSAHPTTLKPEKINRAGGWIYKAAFPSPHLDNVRCLWKGSIFQSVELYAKDAAGQRSPIAHYVRKPNGEHFLRLYAPPSSNGNGHHHVSPSPSSGPSSSAAQHQHQHQHHQQHDTYPNPALPLLIATLYPFLQLYWKYTRSHFTSEKKINQWAATAQPSRWDARLLGKPKGKAVAIANGNGNGNGTNLAQPAHRGDPLRPSEDGADERTLMSFEDGEGKDFDSDEDDDEEEGDNAKNANANAHPPTGAGRFEAGAGHVVNGG